MSEVAFYGGPAMTEHDRLLLEASTPQGAAAIARLLPDLGAVVLRLVADCAQDGDECDLGHQVHKLVMANLAVLACQRQAA